MISTYLLLNLFTFMNLADAFIQRYNTYNGIIMYALIYFLKSA